MYKEITLDEIQRLPLSEKIKHANLICDRIEEIFRLWFDTHGINARKNEKA